MIQLTNDMIIKSFDRSLPFFQLETVFFVALIIIASIILLITFF